MRAILFTLAALLAVTLGQAQFEKFEDLEEVTTVVVNQGMFELLAEMDIDVQDPEAKEFKDIVTKLKGVKVLTTEDAKVGEEMRKAAMSYQAKNRLEELMSVKDKDANIKFYTRKGKSSGFVSELLMVISDINAGDANRKVETVLVSILGDIELKKIGALTSKMNLPNELNKVNKR